MSAAKQGKQAMTAKNVKQAPALKVAQPAKTGLRSATEFQPVKGFTFNGKAKGLLAEIPAAKHPALEAAYRKVVSIIEKFTEDEQMAICAAAVAANDWASIVEASQNQPVWYRAKKLSKRESTIFDAMAGTLDADQLEAFKTAFLAAKKSAKTVDAEAGA